MGTIIDFETGKKSEIIDAPCECEDGYGLSNVELPEPTSSNPFPWVRPLYNAHENKLELRFQTAHDHRIDFELSKRDAREILMATALFLTYADN